MRAGLLREIVTVHRIVETTSASGSHVRTMQIAGQERAAVRQIGGRELIAQSTEGAQYDTEFRMTYPTSVTIDTADVLEWDGVRYDIVSAAPVPGIRAHTLIRAKRGMAQRN